MDHKKDLENLQVTAGKRTYFLDVKRTREDKKYLKISESKRLENGNYERHNIIIFEEDVSNIANAFQEALKHFFNVYEA